VTLWTDLTVARLALARPLLGAGVALAIANPQGHPPMPYTEESASLSPRAVARRRNEFAAGRSAARDAVAQLGLKPGPILAGHDRAPIWPDGLVGSITHSRDCAMAAVARRDDAKGIGIDVEESTPLEDKLFNIICSESERAWLQTQAEPALMAKLIFSAKEAAYKCQYPLSKRLFGFEGMELEIDLKGRAFQARFTEDQPPFGRGAAIPGRFAIGAGLIVTAAELRAGESL
jgi:4'-phosphopantetheinyl transferase EntD